MRSKGETDRGSASVVALGWVIACVLGAGVLTELSAQLITTGRLQAATDRAALAAADVLIGVGGNLPCTVARDILREEGFVLHSCEVSEHGVRVATRVVRWGVEHQKRAHAGVVDGGHQ